MNRKLLVTVHLYLAAFFAPAVLLVGISGGLYLVGIKGNVEQETIYQSSEIEIDSQSKSLHQDVSALLTAAGVNDYNFEYVKISGSTLITRPTSVDHYIVKPVSNALEVIHARPDLQSRMVELHKGHGPTAFKTFQKGFALALVFIILSGLLLGLTAARLRRSTLLTTVAGALVFAFLLV